MNFVMLYAVEQSLRSAVVGCCITVLSVCCGNEVPMKRSIGNNSSSLSSNMQGGGPKYASVRSGVY